MRRFVYFIKNEKQYNSSLIMRTQPILDEKVCIFHKNEKQYNSSFPVIGKHLTDFE